MKALSKVGRHTDGGGLHLYARPSGRKGWVLRFMRDGTLRDMGLGGYPEVSLSQAREATRVARAVIRGGADPIVARQRQSNRDAGVGRTFRAAAAHLIEAHRASWSNPKHAAQWASTLETFVHPVIGDRPLQDVTTDDVLTILRPIWSTKSETASRVRGRMEAVLDAAAAMRWREGENPARWKGHLASLLPKISKVRQVQHHPSLPWQRVGAFLEALRQRDGAGAQAVEFAILTACRSGEARGLVRCELDLEAKVWTVPAARMKGRRVHRVPLSSEAMALLARLHVDELAPDDLVFPGKGPREVLSDMTLTAVLWRMNRVAVGEPAHWVDGQSGETITVHGFRSTFRVWAGEQTEYPREVIEAALAHAVGNEVEGAYARTDLLERRRALMEAWGAHCRSVAVPKVARGSAST